MASLGDFSPVESRDVTAEPDSFMFCGQEFLIPQTAGAGSFLRYAWSMKAAMSQGERGEAAERRALSAEGRAAARAEKISADMGAMSAVWDLLTSILGQDQIDRFARTVDNNGIDLDGILSLVGKLEAAIAARPTKRSSDSSAGPSTTGLHSTDAGSGPTDLPLPQDSFRPMTPREQQIQDLHQHLVTPTGLASQT
ncbi:hypothetical protein [Kineosporia sp. NBRC 101731]|uniref:hypothetical protein n=1 Tax=Kineosporia sp. NBRC 101731 TaxID=3032199 RepID=UPI0024A45F37|nr:hypothetical protein [Kineosporia sp. NBRC 101731]GLY32136.1 hypothetical protein Kisp02_55010 [Kineosporia sp. NBRC 101731]